MQRIGKQQFQLDGGEVVGISRQKISATIYYDDERSDPLAGKDKEAVFIAYNMETNFNDNHTDAWQEEINAFRSRGCCSGRCVIRPYVMSKNSSAFVVFWNSFRNNAELNSELVADAGYTKRELSEQEISGYIDFIAALKAEYTKRLKTYYKRYSGSIHSYGYWANR